MDMRKAASEHWADAQRIRNQFLDLTKNLKKDEGNTNYTTCFEHIEQVMARLRLACLQAIFSDFEFAAETKIESFLWGMHVNLNGEYRKSLNRVGNLRQVVQKRKLEKLYRDFLKTSQSFYRVYIQRLSGRFYIAELREAARGMSLEPSESPARENSPPSKLRAILLKSCCSSLVRLGDLARYRCQASEKLTKATFEDALAYYSLASSVVPEDGSAHHQMAVLHQIHAQHFDIVYHFHRSISTEKPHDLGLQNLGREFQTLGNPSPSKKNSPKDPADTMISWFIKLHAFFFQGEPFSQQVELEEEVLHRLELALKSEGSSGLLLKMVLINIAASDVASYRLRKPGDSSVASISLSHQFSLRFNLRTICILLRLLKAELKGDSAVSIDYEIDTANDETKTKIVFNPTLTKLLALSRVYVAWIYVARADLVKNQAVLEPYINDMYDLLAEALTLLNCFVDATSEVIQSKYLLDEDVEAIGLKPFGDRKLPLFHYTEESPNAPHTPKRHRARKPRKETFGQQYGTNTETIWRIRDIIACGVFLAGSATFPVAIQMTTNSGRQIEGWVCTTNAPDQEYISRSGMSDILCRLKLDGLKNTSERVAQQAQPHQHVADAQSRKTSDRHSPRENYKNSESREGAPASRKAVAPAQECGVPSKSTKSQAQANVAEAKAGTTINDWDISEDSAMVDMVDQLVGVGPVEGKNIQASRADTSYGMNSALAKDVFGQFAAPSSALNSPTYQNLPWEYFQVPGPKHPASTADPRPGLDTGSPLLSEFQQRSNENRRPSLLENSRSAVLGKLTNDLYAQHGLPGLSVGPKYQNAPDTHAKSPENWGRPSPGIPTIFDSAAGPGQVKSPEGMMRRSQSQQLGADSGISSPFQVYPTLSKQPGNYAPGSVSRTSHQGPAAASKPYYDLPERTSEALGRMTPRDSSALGSFRQQHTSSSIGAYPGSSARSNSFAFSHPSSLFAGTPGPESGVSAPPHHSVACNGNFFNASTPFGRLGDVNNRDDPTHFRNVIRETLGSHDDSYDRAVLESALLDDAPRPRQK